MASSSSVVVVDVGALRTLSSRIATARAALTTDAGMFGDGSNGVEHPVLRKALDEFDERWSDKRTQLDEELDKTAEAMRTVADSFEQADDQLAQCVAGEGSAP